MLRIWPLSMDFTQNYFELMSLPQHYSLNKKALANSYRQLQQQFHPDNFSSSSANEQRLAIQFAAYINTAYQTLKSSVLRAEYLLTLSGETIDHQSTTISDGSFLMLQMEWRESLADIKNLDAALAEDRIEVLTKTVKDEKLALESYFESSFDDNKRELAKEVVAKLHFIEKMLREIDDVESLLFD